MARPVRRAPGAEAAVLALSLDRAAPEPLQAQLAGQLRALILAARVAPGARLPSTRALAEELGIARATAVAALEQLAAEGYVEGRRGAGLFVARLLPDHVLQAATVAPPAPTDLPAPPPSPWRPFQVEATDPALFPQEAWALLLQRSWRAHGAAMLGPSDAFGWPPLRDAIARHLVAWRGIAAEGARVVVTSGIADALEIIAAIAFRPGDRVAIEDPGFPPIRHGLARLGLMPVPTAVDEHGLDPARLLEGPEAASLRGAIVAPSRHYPLGVTMPVARRLALLDWARRTGGLVIEDDYDGEYRYAGAPLPALAGLDAAGRAIYVGSFSKVLSRSLRLGFVLLPRGLVAPARAHLARRGVSASVVAQPALAAFLASGEFAAHVRRTRRVYARRMAALVEAARPFEGVLRLEATESGLHAVARLPPGLSDRDASARALRAGIVAAPLSAHAVDGAGPQGLLLGFAGFGEDALAAAMARLGAVLRDAATPRGT